MSNFFDQFDEQKPKPPTNFFDQFDGAAQPGVAAATPTPADTPLGERALGAGLRFLQGSIEATGALGKAAEIARRLSPAGVIEAGLGGLFAGDADVAKNIIARPTASGAFFDPGSEAADELVRSEAPTFYENAQRGVAERDAGGNLIGIQAPSADWLLSGGAQTIPALPSMLVGGGGLTTALRGALANSPRIAAAIGYGGTNAALTAPQQGEDAYQLALQRGATEEEAILSGLAAAGISAPVNAALGGGSAVVSGLAGQGANSITGALLRGMVADVPLGATEEALQPAIVQAAAGAPISTADMLDAGALGGFFEAAVGAGPAISDYRARQAAKTPPPVPADSEQSARVAAAQAQFDAEAAAAAVDGEVTGEQVDEIAARVAEANGVTVEDVLRGTEAEGRQPAPAAPPEPASEADVSDIMQALQAAGIVPEADTEQGSNPPPVAPAAGSQPEAAASPPETPAPSLAEIFSRAYTQQPAPSPSAESVERPQQVQAVTGQAEPSAPAEAPIAESQRDDILALRDEVGWNERGGRLIRSVDGADNLESIEGGGRGTGAVTGRTKWAPKARVDGGGEATWWRNRPMKINEAEANEAFDRLAAGEKLTKKQQGFIDYVASVERSYREERAQDAADFSAANARPPRDDVRDLEEAQAAIDRSFESEASQADDGEVPFQRREAPRASGIPAGLPAVSTDRAGRLAKGINADRARRNLGGKVRLQEIQKAALPDDVARAIDAFERATGTRIVVVRNLTPEVDQFNGVTLRDGVLYIDENADRVFTLVASHEWVHQLKRDQPALYQRLEAEARRQGKIPQWIERMRAEGNATDEATAVEELTADAVADAMTDPAFLRRIVEEGGTLRQAARAFLRYLDTLLGKIKGRNTAAYMADVQAFRDELAAVLREYRNTETQPAESRVVDEDATPSFERRAVDDEFDAEFGDETDRAPIDTPNFRRWFRNSAAVNEDGSPLILFHGTGEEFDAFDAGRLARSTGHSSSGLGFYFTPDRAGAEAYAERASNFVPADAVVLEVYLSIQRPYTMTLREAQSFTSPAESRRFRERLEAQGFDGVHIPEQDAWVAFKPSQVKRTDNLGQWDPSRDNMRFQRRLTGDVFESAALRAIEEGRGAPKRGTAEQWKGWLDGAVRRGEMKQAERDWLDIDGWLSRQSGAVTREALADYVRANQVELEEVRLGASSTASASRTLEQAGYRIEGGGNTARLIGPDGDDNMTRAPASVLEAFAAIVEAPQGARAEANIEQPPRFSSYQLPGGTNYREVLLTLPLTKRDGFAEYLAAYRARFPNATTTDDEVREFHSRGVPVPPDGRTVVQRQADSPVYTSSHWDQPNVLAHVRMNDRTDAQGREVLFVEEIQSDFGQEMRKSKLEIIRSVKADFDGIVERMKAAGVLTVECD